LLCHTHHPYPADKESKTSKSNSIQVIKKDFYHG
jgi:hypothetical protein